MLPKVVFFILSAYLVLSDSVSDDRKQLQTDTGLSVVQIIRKHRYPAELHQDIETQDGYLLEMHRIPHGIDKSRTRNKSVVLLMHGVLCSSVDWINMGPEKGIGYLLADAGYDVWMGNARGNTWSRKHKTMNPDKDMQFWEFSWNEIGIYDLPSMIDYILEKTGQKSLFYIGHSQGTTSFFVMASERPEYNKKIRLMSAMAPIAYMSHLTNPFCRLFSNFNGQLEWAAKFTGIYEFIPKTELLSMMGQASCNNEAMFQEVCKNVIFLIAGFDSEQLNATMIPVISTTTPSGSSSRQLIHYSQEIKSGKFRKYDFGMLQNLDEYGAAEPPRYDISKITAPVALWYSSNDWLASVQDVEQLNSELPHVVYKYKIPYAKFNHLDFLWASDIRQLLYDRVMNIMRGY